MGWARLDDGFYDHPKVVGLSLDAIGLYALALTWAHRHMGAAGAVGFVPVAQVTRLAGSRAKRTAAALVESGLWEVSAGGWLIHDFEDYLPAGRHPQTASEVSKARSEAGRKGAAKRWQSDSNLPPDEWQVAITDEWQIDAPEPEPEPNDFPSGKSSPPRPDVEALCAHLADRIEANGSKRPRITAAWRTSARLLLDLDGRTPEQVRTAIDWCQADEFWRSNILSMPKLREKYDQLRLIAQRGNVHQLRPDDHDTGIDFDALSAATSAAHAEWADSLDGPA